MKKLFFVPALLIASIAVCFAATANLNGQWAGTLKTDDGSQYPLLYKFRVEGDKLTGTVRGPHGDLQISEGEVHDNTFSFSVTLDKLYLVHTGKVYPDSISMNIETAENKAHTTLLRSNN